MTLPLLPLVRSSSGTMCRAGSRARIYWPPECPCESCVSLLGLSARLCHVRSWPVVRKALEAHSLVQSPTLRWDFNSLGSLCDDEIMRPGRIWTRSCLAPGCGSDTTSVLPWSSAKTWATQWRRGRSTATSNRRPTDTGDGRGCPWGCIYSAGATNAETGSCQPSLVFSNGLRAVVGVDDGITSVEMHAKGSDALHRRGPLGRHGAAAPGPHHDPDRHGRAYTGYRDQHADDAVLPRRYRHIPGRRFDHDPRACPVTPRRGLRDQGRSGHSLTGV